VAAVELEDPAGDVVEKVAIMGHGDHRTLVVMQKALEPGHRLGVQMVGRLVEQQHVGLGEQQPAQRHATFLAAGEFGDVGVPGRQAQRVGGNFEGAVQLPGAGRVDLVLQLGLLGEQGVEIGIRLGKGVADGVEAVYQVLDLAHAVLDVAAHVLGRIQLGLLGQKADLDPRLRPGLAFEFLVDASHDAQQGGLARAVESQHADLGAGKEGQRHVAQDLALGRDDLADAMHGVDVLRHERVPEWAPAFRKGRRTTSGRCGSGTIRRFPALAHLVKESSRHVQPQHADRRVR